MGVTDAQGHYIGTLSAGIKIRDLVQNLENVTQPMKINFHLLNEKNQIIASDRVHTTLPTSCEKPPIFKKWEQKENNFLNFNPHIIKMKNYNFKVVTYYSEETLKNVLLPLFFSRITTFILITLSGLALLLFFRHTFIKPISKLSQQASAISMGKFIHDKWQHYYGLEIRNLAIVFLQVKRYVLRNKRFQTKLHIANQKLLEANSKLSDKQLELEKTQEELKKAIQIADESDKARQKFVMQIRKDLKVSLSNILQSCQYMLNNTEVDDIFISHVNHINNAAQELKSLTRVNLSLYPIVLNDLIKESIQIHKKRIFEKHLFLQEELQNNLPLIKADKLRLQQVLVCLIHKAIDNSPEQSTIFISSKKEKSCNKKNAYVSIQIKDSGFGLNEDVENRIKTKLLAHQTEVTDDVELELDMIQKLIELHEGQFHISREWGQGTCYTISIPLDFPEITPSSKNVYYLNKKDMGCQ